MKKNIDRFYKKGWGVFTHFLDYNQNNAENPLSYGKCTSWEECVNDFDVKLVARQLADIGAGYYFITVMQGSIHLIAPNSTFDKIAGTKPGEACSTRDIPMELADELAKYDIDLYLYFTGDGPWTDPVIGPKFGYTTDRMGNMNMPFVEKWASVLEEYAVRYGDKVKGWWIDGCYDYFGYTNDMLIPYKNAVEKGNPDAIVTFNNGKLGGFEPQWDLEDYICGETNLLAVLPKGRFVNGKQNHALGPIGKGKSPYARWGTTGLGYDEDYIFDYLEAVLNGGGVISFDTGTYRDGHFEPFQLCALKAANERYIEKYGPVRKGDL